MVPERIRDCGVLGVGIVWVCAGVAAGEVPVRDPVPRGFFAGELELGALDVEFERDSFLGAGPTNAVAGAFPFTVDLRG